MEVLVWILLGVAFVLAFITFRIGTQSGWHWGGALAAALIPVAFTYFLGIIGIIIAFAFVVAVWKAN